MHEAEAGAKTSELPQAWFGEGLGGLKVRS